MSDLSHVPTKFIEECREMGLSDSMIAAMVPKPKRQKDADRKRFFASQGSGSTAPKEPVKCAIHITCSLCGATFVKTGMFKLKANDPTEWDSFVSTCEHCYDKLQAIDKDVLIKLIMIQNGYDVDRRMLSTKKQLKLAEKLSVTEILHTDMPETRAANMFVPDAE